ncbi:MAG: hypothetical protein Q9208_007848 [Pyrenodesmia sp. 3 TL-2023]
MGGPPISMEQANMMLDRAEQLIREVQEVRKTFMQAMDMLQIDSEDSPAAVQEFFYHPDVHMGHKRVQPIKQRHQHHPQQQAQKEPALQASLARLEEQVAQYERFPDQAEEETGWVFKDFTATSEAAEKPATNGNAGNDASAVGPSDNGLEFKKDINKAESKGDGVTSPALAENVAAYAAYGHGN